MGVLYLNSTCNIFLDGLWVISVCFLSSEIHVNESGFSATAWNPGRSHDAAIHCAGVTSRDLGFDCCRTPGGRNVWVKLGDERSNKRHHKRLSATAGRFEDL